MKPFKYIFAPGTALAALASALLIIQGVATFDLDEALYRRVAEEMKISGNYFIPTWDGEPFFHKPPVYYWSILGSSFILGDPVDRVSSAAARVPGFILSWLTALMLAWAWPILIAGSRAASHFKSRWFPAFMFSLGLLPATFAATVFFDPMQTLALTPALLIGTRHFMKGPARRAGGWGWFVFGFSMFAGVSIKGLQAFVIPGFVFVACTAIEWGRSRSRKALAEDFKFGFKSLLVAVVFGAAFFFYLHQKAGPAFTHEFFFVQHFQRGTTAMEGHSGFFGFYLLILAAGSGVLGSLMILLIPGFGKNTPVFPWIWVGAFILFFSAMSTQLPNYIWPVWPALALAAALGIANGPAKLTRKRQVFSAVPLLLPIIVFGALVFVGSRWPELSFLPSSEVIKLRDSGVIWPAAFSYAGWAGLFAGAAFLGVVFFQPSLRKIFGAGLATQVIWMGAFNLGILPGAAELIPAATERLAAWAGENIKEGECLLVEGPRSASVSLGYRRWPIGKCPPDVKKRVLAPLWNQHDCLKHGLKVQKRDQFVVLCGSASE